MNAFSIVRDAWFFYSRNFASIVRLCLPLIFIEACAELAVDHWLVKDNLPARDLLIGLVFYPLYTGALILFLDARSRGQQPPLNEVFARALRLWPSLALLAALGTVLIMLGASLFVLPGLWIMVKIAFAEYLLVLNGMTPLAALKQSFIETRRHFWLILGCILLVLLPLWLLEAGLAGTLGDDLPTGALPTLLLGSAVGLVQLLATVVLFRCFMLCSESAARETDKQ